MPANPTVVNAVSATATATTVTTPAITSTSGNFIAVGVGNFVRDVGATDVTDNKGNGWTVAWRQTGLGRSQTGLFYNTNINGGSSHTFTNTPTGGSDTTCIGVIEFSGMPNNNTLDVTANAAVGVSLGFPSELNRSGATAYTAKTSSLLIGVATSPTQPVSKELFVDQISLANGAVEDILFSWYITTGAGTYNFKQQGGNNCSICAFKGFNIRVIQIKTAQSGSAASITTAAMTTTSGNFLAGGCCDFTQTITGTRISDSKSNTWQTGRIQGRIATYYAENCIGGSGHTFTFTPVASDFLAIGIYEISGINSSSSLDVVNGANSGGNSGDIVTNQAEELLLGLNTNGSGGPSQSTSILGTSPWIEQLTINSFQSFLMAWRIVNKKGQYQFGVNTQSNNPEGVGIAAFKLPGNVAPQSPQIGVPGVLLGDTVYATPARAINIEILASAAAVLEGSVDGTNFVTLGSIGAAGMFLVSGVVTPFIRPSVDITVVFRKTKAKL